MITPIQTIKTNEQSASVANLQAAIQAMGFTVYPAEVKDQRAGDSTTQLVSAFQRQMNLMPAPGYLVDPATASAMNQALQMRGMLASNGNVIYTVHGTVRQPDGNPARELSVTAFDQDMRKRQPLGQVQTDAAGFYKITYSSTQFQQAELGGPDLVIEVTGQNQEILLTSDVMFNAPVLARMDLKLATTGSEDEYSRIVRLLTVLVAGQDVTLDTLEENNTKTDLTFAAGETGISKDELTAFAMARRLPATTKLPAEFWFAILAASVITPDFQTDTTTGVGGLVANVVDKLPDATAASVEAGLNKALAGNLIAKSFKDSFPVWLREYAALLSSEATKAGSTSGAQSIIAAAGFPVTKNAAFLDAYLQGGTRDEILQRLNDGKQFTAPEISGIEATLILNDMTFGDAKLLAEFRKGIAAASNVATLARMSQQDWLTSIKNSGTTPPAFVAGDTADAKQANYATLLMRRAALAYPTAAFAGDLARAIDAKAGLGIRMGAQVLQFFDTHPDFELATTSIDGYMKLKARPEFVNAANKDQLVASLKASQRVFKLTANFSASNTLLSDGLHSARQIYGLGATQFVQKYGNQPGFTAASAGATYQRAANTHGAAITLIGEIRAYLNANHVQCITNSPTNSPPLLGQFPDLNNLFGNADSCACSECESIFGASAYLADLLHFLESRLLPAQVMVPLTIDGADKGATSVMLLDAAPTGFPQNGTITAIGGAAALNFGYTLAADGQTLTLTGGASLPGPVVGGTQITVTGFALPVLKTVKDLLFHRRPDAGYIELSCANSDTPVLYIDLANEIMEDQVAPSTLFTLPLALQGNFTQGPPNAAIINAFATQATPVTLTNAAMISAQDASQSWVIHDTAQTYRVQPAAMGLVVSILRQTHGTADELSANPEYVNQAAYDILAQAVSPLALPFDLATEEVRAFLNYSNVDRSDLMTQFRSNNPPNNPTALDIAAEHLDFVPAEKDLILVPHPANQYKYWGLAWGDRDNPSTIISMTAVDTFLLRSGLEYADLQRMLTLPFVNPGGALSIQGFNPDAPCDTSAMKLQVLDANALDRIHRFLRLWNKLGWKMWELDLVINHPALGNGTLDHKLVLKLYPFLKIKEQFPTLTVEQLCAFYGDINTAGKFTAAYQKPDPSLYENLFTNKRLTNPLDPVFTLNTASVASAHKGDGVLTLQAPAPAGFPPAGRISSIAGWPGLGIDYTLGADKKTLTLASNVPIEVGNGAIIAVPSLAGQLDDPSHLASVLAATKLKQTDLKILGQLAQPGAYPVAAANPGSPTLTLKSAAPATFPPSGMLLQLGVIGGLWTGYTLGADKQTLTLASPLANLIPDGTLFGTGYIDDSLDLENLSFIYRHALLAKQLKIKIADWQTFLFLLQQNVFQDPATTWDFLQFMERINASQFTLDQLDYILTGDLTRKSAQAEKTITPTLAKLQKSLQAIATAYDPAAVPVTADGLNNALNAQLSTLGWDAATVSLLLGVLSNQVQQQRALQNPPAPATVTVSVATAGASIVTLPAAAGAGFPPSSTILQLGSVTGLAIGYTLAADNLTLNLSSPLPASVASGSQNAVIAWTFPTAITAQAQIGFDPVTNTIRFTGIMTDAQKTLLQTSGALGAITANPSYQNAIQDFYDVPRLMIKFYNPYFTAPLAALPVNVQFGKLSKNLAARIQYDTDLLKLTYMGIMTTDDQAALIALAPGSNDYVGAVGSLFSQPRQPAANFPNSELWLTLDRLVSYSPSVVAASPGDTSISLKAPNSDRFPQTGYITQIGGNSVNLSYTLGPDQVTLTLNNPLTAAVADGTVIVVPSAVENLALAELGLPNTIAAAAGPAAATVLQLQTAAPAGFPASGTIIQIGAATGINLAYTLSADSGSLTVTGGVLPAVAEGTPITLGFAPITSLAAYVARKLSIDQVIQQLSAALGLTQALAQNLLEEFAIFGKTPNLHALLTDFLDPGFINSGSTITSGAFPELFEGYYWLHRVALVINNLGIAMPDLTWIVQDQAATKVLDFTKLPITFTAGAPTANLAPLVDLSGFMQLHHQYSDDSVSLLNVVDQLINPPAGGYANSRFATDVEALAGWTASDVLWVTTANNLDVAYPAAYQTLAGWLRLQQEFLIIQQLNASAQSAASLAAPVLQASDSTRLKGMLRGQTDDETWAGVSKPIEDSLRERKRDSLVAYLLSQAMPADAPTQKWEDPEDLFAYYLIDVEMGSCQPSSRVVQASAAVQLLVQRCLMGLEPQVRVSVDVDSGWSQWSWMKYYRVWEANREVFAYPENYAEPDLRKNKSEIFESLETELQQNDATPDNIQTAFIHYLDALDNIAQLEIAGTYYQESSQILHVFGRTPGATPHIYYYRQFNYLTGWTGWKKVDCDIQSDYLVPLVSNERLYLVWPEYQQQPQTPTNSGDVPNPGDTSPTMAPPTNTMQVFLAISEFKSGKWTPKKRSTDIVESAAFQGNFDYEHLFILPLDFTWLGLPFLLLIVDDTYDNIATFELMGCQGYPQLLSRSWPTMWPRITRFERDDLEYLKNVENSETPDDTLTPIQGMNWVLTQEILARTPGTFKITYPDYMSYFDRLFVSLELIALLGNPSLDRDQRERLWVSLGTFYNWFYADGGRTFFVRPELLSGVGQTTWYYEDLEAFFKDIIQDITTQDWTDLIGDLRKFLSSQFHFSLQFSSFYHPFTCLFKKQLYLLDVEGLMSRETQFASGPLDFNAMYAPQPVVDPNYPQEVVDFDLMGSYSLYNWEVFYHAPLMVAERLSQNQQFEEAMRWYHFIFDPTGGHDTDPRNPGTPVGAPQKYWITKPFFLRQDTGPNGYFAENLINLMSLLASDPANPSTNPAVAALQQQVAAWRQDPFDPHLIAQYRTVAYQKLVVMKYLDNLIAWGDNLFQTDTLESVNSATQLYVVAAEILGPRPLNLPPPAKPMPQTFNELDSQLDAFSNAMVGVENLIPPMPGNGGGGPPAPPLPNLLYFGIPQNSQLLTYWDTIDDRLYKIRHCLNLDGVFNPSALFAPPINPADLVKAMAAGLDISSALADLQAPLPFYRFATMTQKANEFTNDVKSLGAALLSALEKSDAEGLALLRQGQETALLQAVRGIKQRQIDDAQLVIDGLQKNKELITIRRDYYSSREFMNAGESTAMALSGASTLLDAGIAAGYILAGGLRMIPTFVAGGAGFGGSPEVNVQIGGEQISGAADDAVKTMSSIAAALDKGASIASTVAGYQRRSDDWGNQVNMANKELEQNDKQIASAQVKLDVAQKDLANQDLQIANSQAVNAFMQGKYTNQELYNWMIGQVSKTYFQAYQLAYSLAKQAERCFQFEIGVENTSYIKYGYWDSLRKGLQAGESLQMDLRRLEGAYLDQNRREFECTKHVSMAILSPAELLNLKNRGICTFSIPEEFFDLDYAGHYFRRIKSVSISIPCVAGPNTTVSATLRLVKNMVRINTQLGDQYQHNQDDDTGAFTDDDRFRESQIRINSIAASSAQNDSGMFELNFRDERYLPFEGAGAISTWQLELTQDSALRQFSYDTISDVILHLRYTSREDTGPFRDAAVAHLKNDVLGDAASLQLPLVRLFDIMHEFPTEFYDSLHPQSGTQPVLQLDFGKERYPYFVGQNAIQLQSILLMVRAAPASALLTGTPSSTLNLTGPKQNDESFATAQPVRFSRPDVNRFLSIALPLSDGVTIADAQSWQIQLVDQSGKPLALSDGDIQDCYLLVQYTLSS